MLWREKAECRMLWREPGAHNTVLLYSVRTILFSFGIQFWKEKIGFIFYTKLYSNTWKTYRINTTIILFLLIILFFGQRDDSRRTEQLVMMIKKKKKKNISSTHRHTGWIIHTQRKENINDDIYIWEFIYIWGNSNMIHISNETET